MSWIRLDDGFSQHPKLLEVGPEGLTLQIRAFCYAGRYLTDGFLPSEVAEGLTHGLSQDSMGWPNRMVAAKLWEKRKNGYFIHDYLRYNLSKEQILEARKKKAEGGRKGADNRWHRTSNEGQAHTHAIAQPITTPISTPRSHPIGARHAPNPIPNRDKKILNPNSHSQVLSATTGNGEDRTTKDLEPLTGLGETVKKLGERIQKKPLDTEPEL